MKILPRWIIPLSMLAASCVRDEGWRYDGGRTTADVHTTAAIVDAGGRPARIEVCANGVDDNGDGRIDENCVCLVDTTHRCFAGATSSAGVGACGFGTQTCVRTANGPAWGECVGQGTPSAEICDGYDNDCNGVVDEGCACDPAHPPTCYRGPVGTAGVGRCRAGTLRCPATQPTGDVPSTIPCIGDVMPQPEVCDGIDNDCNGAIDDIAEVCDGVDNNCNGIVDEGCPVAHRAMMRYLGAVGSGIIPGDSDSLYVLQDTTVTCPHGKVPVEASPGNIVCADPPAAACPAGQHPVYGVTGWLCVDCALIVQFGYLFNGERDCAPYPPDDCPPGTVHTFDANSKTWICRPPCDNGQYDLYSYGALQMCVPC